MNRPTIRVSDARTRPLAPARLLPRCCHRRFSYAVVKGCLGSEYRSRSDGGPAWQTIGARVHDAGESRCAAPPTRFRPATTSSFIILRLQLPDGVPRNRFPATGNQEAVTFLRPDRTLGRMFFPIRQGAAQQPVHGGADAAVLRFGERLCERIQV